MENPICSRNTINKFKKYKVYFQNILKIKNWQFKICAMNALRKI
ncbi:hypothetical protein J500_0956 [Acinetobacter sp. 479375]|nr:hypothetical protein J500_0956 [Acinetobacter sp. 479375]